MFPTEEEVVGCAQRPALQSVVQTDPAVVAVAGERVEVGCLMRPVVRWVLW